MNCNKIFNIINIIFLILFLSIIFTGNTFNVYNNIRNTITNSNYEINKDVFYISKNILSLPIIIIIYFFLNNTKINIDFTNQYLFLNNNKIKNIVTFLEEFTDLKPNKPIPFIYLFNISNIILFCPVIMIFTLSPLYIFKYLSLNIFGNKYSYILFGLFICYLLLEIVLYFTNQNNTYSYVLKCLYFFIVILLLIFIPIFIYKKNTKNNNHNNKTDK